MDASGLRDCPFCNGRQFRLDESNMWTGRSNQLLSVTLRHWCDFKPYTSSINMVAATKEKAIEQWNGVKEESVPS